MHDAYKDHYVYQFRVSHNPCLISCYNLHVRARNMGHPVVPLLCLLCFSSTVRAIAVGTTSLLSILGNVLVILSVARHRPMRLVSITIVQCDPNSLPGSFIGFIAAERAMIMGNRVLSLFECNKVEKSYSFKAFLISYRRTCSDEEMYPSLLVFFRL